MLVNFSTNIQFALGPRVQASYFQVSNWRKIIHISLPAFSGKYFSYQRFLLTVKFQIQGLPTAVCYCITYILPSYLLQNQRTPQTTQSVSKLTYWPTVSGIVFLFLPVATDYLLHQGNNTSRGFDLAPHSMSTEKLPEGLCNLGVHLTTHLHLVPPVRIRGDILPMPHINMFLTTNSIMITAASLDKNPFEQNFVVSLFLNKCDFRWNEFIDCDSRILTGC